MIVSDGLMTAARRTPDKIAIVYDGVGVLTYGKLAMALAQTASAMGGHERIAIVMKNAPWGLIAFFGAVRSGAIAMVMNPSWPGDLQARVLAEHRPSLVIDQDVTRDDAGAAATLPKPDAAFLMGFTSGTTGTPKAFLRSHASWTATFAAARAEFGALAEGRVLAPGPLCHSLTLYTAVETLEAGGTILLQSQFDAAACGDLLAAGAAETFVGVPAMLDLLTASASAEVQRQVTFVSAGAKLTPPLRAKLRGVYPRARVFEYYGASELSFVSVSAPDDLVPEDSVGRAFQDVTVAVRRADGLPAMPGEIGTVWVRSPMLSQGYVGAGDGTGFRVDPADATWATVGDQGHLDAAGFLYLAGREHDMLISGGYNIYPQEIERVLSGADDVRAAAVFGVDDPRWGQVVAAVIEGPATRAVLEAVCAAALPPYKWPRRWWRIGKMPRTASGKIAIARLREMLPGLESVS